MLSFIKFVRFVLIVWFSVAEVVVSNSKIVEWRKEGVFMLLSSGQE